MYTYYPDYDQAAGVLLKDLDEKVNYLACRMNLILINPLKEFFRIRAKNSKIFDLNLGTCTLICEGISGLSTYYKGDGDGGKFKNFVKDYVYPSHPKKEERADLLWRDVRCCLTHGFYIRHARIEDDKSKHYMPDSNKRIIIDLETFFKEFGLAVDRFLSDVRKGKSAVLVTNFEDRFNKVFRVIVKKQP